MIYWMKGERFIEELEGHIREGEVRYFLDYLLLKILYVPQVCWVDKFLIESGNRFLSKECWMTWNQGCVSCSVSFVASTL